MLEKVINIVRESSKLMENRVFQVESKGSIANNVTTIDLSVEAYLKKHLMNLLDNCSFIGEESSDNECLKEYLWIVDPIDGTANFIRDMGLSAISVALVKDGEPILGVVFNPYRDEMFYAEKGKGAYLNGESIKVSNNNLEHSIFCTALSLYRKDYAKYCMNIIDKVYQDCEDVRRLGSAALELVALASGRVELYFEIRLYPWDFAAAEVIIKEAGGYVGTIEFDKTVFYRPIPLICANTKENFEYLKGVVMEEIPRIPYQQPTT